MMSASRSVCTALAIVGATAFAFAQGAPTPALNAKLGLWELTMTVNMGGAPPAYDSSKMTPEQKAQMDAAMAGFMAKPQTSTKQRCFTKDALKEDLFPTNAGQTCKDKFVTNSSTVLDVSRACTGNQTEQQTIHVETTAGTAMTGKIHQTTSMADGKTQVVDVTMTGKWVKADCGTVK